MEELFGSLRSHLSAQHRDVYWRAALWALLQEAHAQDPERYQEQWVPYLSAQTFWQEAPLASFERVVPYREACKVAPFALFLLNFWGFEEPDDLCDYAEYGAALEPSDLATEFYDLDQVYELRFGVDKDEVLYFEHWGSCTWPEYLMSRAKRAKLKQLKLLTFAHEGVLEGAHRNVLAHLGREAFPAIEALEFDNEEPVNVLESLSTAFVEGLRALHIDRCRSLTHRDLERLLERADLSRLQELTLLGLGVDDEMFKLLCRVESSLTGLRLLDLTFNRQLTVLGLEALAHAPFAETLEHLELYNDIKYSPGFGAILGAQAFGDVKTLHINVPFLHERRQRRQPLLQEFIQGVPGHRQLTVSVNLNQAERWSGLLCDESLPFELEALNLDECLSLEELDALLLSRSCAGLMHLSCGIGADASNQEACVRRLASHMVPFKSLALSCGQGCLSAEALKLLIEAPAFSQLEALSVRVAPEHEALLLRRFSSVRRLELVGLSEAGARLLIEEFGQLQWLRINRSEPALSARLSVSARAQEALRAAECGELCVYPWMS